MQPKTSPQWLLLGVSVGGIGFSLLVVSCLVLGLSGHGFSTKEIPPSVNETSQDQGVAQEKERSGIPTHIKIPRINVDAVVEHVGLTKEGILDVPKGPNDTAWFDLGPRPGETGSAVISGHYGWKNNLPAAFDDLHALQKGDKVYVQDEMGSTTTFVVRELKLYGDQENISSVFGSSDDQAHLNLITCEGIWNKVRKSYSNRLVVFTDKE